MKKYFIGLLALALACSGRGISQMVSGDPGATFVGAAIGGNVGGAIGGPIGDNNGGWRGGYRGSAVGIVIRTIAGATIGGAVFAPKQEGCGYRVKRMEPYEPQPETYPVPSVFDNLKARSTRFIDDNHDHVITSGESSKVILEIMNEGDWAIYDMVPVVTETMGMKCIYIFPSIMVEQVAPHNGVKYTTNISADEQIKTGDITMCMAVANDSG